MSVIVPIYNVEQYLRECIDSILKNTYRNLEVILVDDGSPDHCREICDEYAEKDSRVIVIHQENKGLVRARNAGLEIATGEYISFIDSDDAVSPIFYEVMVKNLQECGADMVACGYSYTREQLDMNTDAAYQPMLFNEYEQMVAVITSAPSARKYSWTGCNVWNKIYKRDNITVYFDPKRLMCEDLCFNIDYIHNCRKLVTLPLALNYYRINEDSIMGNYRKSSQKLNHGICHANMWAELANQPYLDTELKEYLCARAVYMAHGALLRIQISDKFHNYKDYDQVVQTLVKDWVSYVWKDKENYNFRIRMSITIMRYAFPVWISTARMIGKVKNNCRKQR